MNNFDWDASNILSHCLLTVAVTWAVAGLLRGVLNEPKMTIANRERPEFLQLGITETTIVLGLLDLRFLSFVIVQFRYFFGGVARVQAVAALTYAEYYRSGFFELVGVATAVERGRHTGIDSRLALPGPKRSMRPRSRPIAMAAERGLEEMELVTRKGREENQRKRATFDWKLRERICLSLKRLNVYLDDYDFRFFDLCFFAPAGRSPSSRSSFAFKRSASR